MIIHNLGIKDYTEIWEQMKEFTEARDNHTCDELWLLEHYPVYTQGQAGKPEHVLNANSIKIVQSDRGGQVTYHGPGQLVAYVLMDIRRRNLGIKTLVTQLEQILISVLEHYKIAANIRSGAPGVYIGEKKIASIGLRVKNGCTYHGIALNVNMDLNPFSGINPCGFAKMEMTQMSHFYPNIQLDEVSQHFVQYFLNQFR
ncbi:lipoyl(octanoyl) transferase LipB [Legionella pneumophila]|uniref:Octanoyltransferase n=1 Tax=Legionella pneumophila subsp. pascullei TaxID=91890 RepID=A0AAX2IWX1_LEGPN|nr:lipoyl(octanoyl) transferase LipB [Legionella pneumophila]AMP89835.1 octanoyltransferase [Legionella pneumophila subsp. pascullei]AMP92499.1 octanoyltransferase [Legionella pneumophila subsp. pascullei]AMP95465.1 octanoyltransferase [Legionella pneumophila subsp. pascullei]SQG90368.1 lipoyl(octanoyl) transferase [Legionella pneumophila subsp. pascullei]VEH06569.1 lipoyl(octanoyl) transferase [Legionella pneumophila subsp. pascullei]